MRKQSTRKPNVPDVPADNPVGTMERFTDGLRRVLSTPKKKPKRSKRNDDSLNHFRRRARF
jgi:hypothetical protein